MKRVNLFLIFTGLITLLSCGTYKEKKSVNDTMTIKNSIDSGQLDQTANVQLKDTVLAGNDSSLTSLLIGSFKNIPGEIEGCGCYFSLDKNNFKRNEYIFVSSYDSIAFISLDKKLIRLKMLSTTREAETFGDYDYIEVYGNDTYKVTLDIKYIKSIGDETWENNGTITIRRKDGKKAVKKFFGECGC